MKDKKTFYTETREEQAERLFSSARAQRSTTDDYWKKMRAYYDGCHETARQTGDFLSSIDLPWVPASVPDAYMHVESQIDSHILHKRSPYNCFRKRVSDSNVIQTQE